MSFDKNLNPGDVIDIQIIRKDNQLISLKSTIYEFVSDVLIKIAMPSYMGKLFPITNGTRIYIVDNIDNKGIYTFYAYVKDKNIEDNLPTLTIERISDIKKSQRRKFFRIPYYREVTFKLPIPEENQKIDEKLLEKYKNNPDVLIEPDEFEFLNVTTKDLSGGGFKFSSSKSFDVGEKLNGNMKIEGHLIEFSVIIKRIVEDLVYNNIYEVGCEFIDIDELDRSRIISIIFKKQRDIVKKGLV